MSIEQVAVTIHYDPRASGSTPWTPDPDTGFTDELCWEADE